MRLLCVSTGRKKRICCLSAVTVGGGVSFTFGLVISRSASDDEENLIDVWNGTVGEVRPGDWTEYVDDGSLSGLDGPGEETFSSITVVGRPTKRIRHAEIRWWSKLKFPLSDLADHGHPLRNGMAMIPAGLGSSSLQANVLPQWLLLKTSGTVVFIVDRTAYP